VPEPPEDAPPTVTTEPPEDEVLEWHVDVVASVADATTEAVSEDSLRGGTPLSAKDQKMKSLLERMRDKQDHEAEPFQMNIEINNLEMTPEEKLKYDQIDILMDSGAGTSVADPKTFPGCIVTDSPGSLAGQQFIGPAGDRIDNEGQFTVPVRLNDGLNSQPRFQAAQVRKPLMAVSSVNDKGNLVVFDGSGSFIIPGTQKELISQLRALIQKVPDKVPLQRKNGVFHMKAWKLKPGFTRQGR